jgi:hypothetical protein
MAGTVEGDAVVGELGDLRARSAAILLIAGIPHAPIRPAEATPNHLKSQTIRKLIYEG